MVAQINEREARAYLAGLAPFIAIIFVLVVGTACSDEFDNPGLSVTEARELTAQFLCPQAPETVMPELIAASDSGVMFVYFRVSPRVRGPIDISGPEDYKAKFQVIAAFEDRESAVLPHDDRSKAFMAEPLESCPEEAE